MSKEKEREGKRKSPKAAAKERKASSPKAAAKGRKAAEREQRASAKEQLKEERRLRKARRKRREKRMVKDCFQRRLQQGMNARMAGLRVAVVLIFVCLLARLATIFLADGDQYKREVLSQSQSSYSSEKLPFKRGDILDRNGTALATSEKRYNVILDCRAINDLVEANDKIRGLRIKGDDGKIYVKKYLEPTIKAILTVFDVDELALRHIIGDEKTCDSQYYVLFKEVPVEQKKAFEYLKKSPSERAKEDGIEIPEPTPTEVPEEQAERTSIGGVWFEETYRRVYPLHTLACNAIGFTNADGSASYGLEGYYKNTLEGVDGRRFGYWNGGQGGEESQLRQTIIQPVDGNSIRTTLDVNIQKICEDELARFNSLYKGNFRTDDDGAANLGVLVMDPRNASVLGMACSNVFDLNNPRDLSVRYTQEESEEMQKEAKRVEEDNRLKEDDEKESNPIADALQGIWQNYCISSIYEPGSTFKPVTVSAALETAKVDEQMIFNCDGGQEIGGIMIHCSDEKGHGDENVCDAIRNSCNDALMQIGELVDVEDFNRFQRIFHFGSKTGIDLSGEAAGILYTADTMKPINLATASFGQGFSCTMIQEAAAICSIINGGNYWEPHLVDKVMDSSGTVKNLNNGNLLGQTVSEATAKKVKSYMKAAVESGTAVSAKVNGYSMGGKTGTAEKFPRGEGRYLVSFIGFAPYENPEVLIYVVVDEPNLAEQDDSRYAQWIAKSILKQILPYLNIYPDEELAPENPILLSTYDNPSGEPRSDSAHNDDIPAAPGVGAEEEVPEDNTPQDLGYTNDEAGFTD